MEIVIPPKIEEDDRGWSIIRIEGYCLKDIDYIKKSEPYNYKYKDPDQWEKVPNEDYDPDVKIPDDPPYCEKRVCFTCLSNKCPYFAYAKYEDRDEDELEWMGYELDDYADVFQEMDKNLKDTLIELGENVGDYTYE